MKKIDVNNSAAANKAKELSESRIASHSTTLFNYLHNYDFTQIAPIRLMHFLIKKKAPKELIQFAISNYYINLVSIWETFFRDLFILAISMDKDLKDFVCNRCIKNHSSARFDDAILALTANFQNITDISEAFMPILDNKNILDYIGAYEQNIFLEPRLIEGFTLDNALCDWKELVAEVFSLRHKFIHDANYKHEFNLDETEKIEWLFNIVPKLFANILADKYNLDRFSIEERDGIFKICKGRNKFNYIFGVGEIVNFEDSFIKDWMVKVEE